MKTEVIVEVGVVVNGKKYGMGYPLKIYMEHPEIIQGAIKRLLRRLGVQYAN